MIGELKTLLVIPHIKIHNANALSSPFTIGFPAMTAWMGGMHALERELKKRGVTVQFNGVGVISHQVDLQTYKGENDYVWSIVGTGNPLDKTGERSPFIEEARCHLDVSLIVEMKAFDQEQEEAFIGDVTSLLKGRLKIAGGDIFSFDDPYIRVIEETDSDKSEFKKVVRRLMPGYALIERRELMIEAMEAGQDAIDALLDYQVLHHRSEEQPYIDEEGNETKELVWTSRRKTVDGKSAGWLVPIATGFHCVTGFVEAKNQRDSETPHRFSESVVTLGEFRMLHRFKLVEDLIWCYQPDLENNLYLCQIGKGLSEDESFEDQF